jgi:hypothetical protein
MLHCVLFAIEFLLVDVSIAAFTPIMIAAATGALSLRLSWMKLFY